MDVGENTGCQTERKVAQKKLISILYRCQNNEDLKHFNRY